MNKHPVANNKIFFAKTKISVTLATQVGEVAASQKLLKILTICNFRINFTSAVCDTVKTL